MVPAAVLLACLLPARMAGAAGIVDHGGVRAVVDSGHRGAVLALDYDDGRKLLFSTGADGTVRIWDPVARVLIRSLTVTNLRVGMVAADPAATQVAVLVTDGIHFFSVEVWDWEQEKRLYQIPLDDAPLFIRYSASGRYILFSTPSWKSLRIVDAGSGKPVPVPAEESGIVELARLSRTEKVLMTYRLTGSLSYFDLASGRLLEKRDTVPQISHARISHDLSFMVGSTDTGIFRIDLGTGAVQASADLPGVTGIDISPADDQIACTRQGSGVSLWSLASGTLAPAALPQQAPQDASTLRFGSESLFVGGRDGNITSVSGSGETASFPGDERAQISGIAARGDMLALATSAWLKVFVSGLAGTAAQSTSDAPGTLRAIQVDNPFKTPAGLLFLDDNSLLVYRSADGPGDYRIFDIPSRSFRLAPTALPAPVIEAQADGSRCLLLAKDGTLRIIGLPDGSPRLEVTRPGAMWATLTSGHAVVVAGDPGVSEQGSLVKINTDTGETDPIPSRNKYSYEVVFDPVSGVLYSLGVDADDRTNLLSHTGSDFQKETPIDSSLGEHLFASLAIEAATGTLYTTLGREWISQWKDGALKRLGAPAQGASLLLSGNGALYALNRDSSVSITSPSAGRPVGELSLFVDGGWVLTLPDGRFAASQGKDSLVNVLDGQRPVQNKGSFVIPVQIAEGP